jgi:threonine dehydratase
VSADGPDLAAARRRIEGHVWRTPVFRVEALDAAVGRELWLKPEALQRTGSFKLRGATNAIRALPPGTSGVVAESSGNHAQAVARAARAAGLPAAIVMPADSNAAKVAATLAYGAEVVQDGVDGRNRGAVARALADERGWHLVHPFDDWDVISGQGTATLELLEDAPALDAVVTPVGGGGLLSGAALACAQLSPATQVWGAEPAVADDVHRSLQAGRRVALDAPPDTIADGVRTLLHGERPFSVLRERCAGIALVPEDAIRAALGLVWSRTKLMIEPTSALPVAAVLAGDIPGQRIGIVLSGGNLEATALARRVG